MPLTSQLETLAEKLPQFFYKGARSERDGREFVATCVSAVVVFIMGVW
jgi:hypothetical protein